MKPLLTWLLVAVVSTLAACAGGSGEGASDPDRMSDSEYDIARDLWLRRSSPRQALDHALKAVELNDENADAAHLVALLYMDFCSRSPVECRLPEAEKHARLALKARADYREATNTLGVILIHQKRYAEAILVLKPLTEDILYHTPEIAWGNLGWAQLESGGTDAAIESLRRSVAAQPLFCVGLFRLGLAYERRREDTAAAEALTRALETQAPGCNSLQDAYAARARIELRLGNQERARTDLARCVELSRKTSAGKECSSMLQKFK
ncbi:MAG TPA: tetratricopeptide repeat protein [Polyangiaceae bacterium]|nr:tetratricopeptide repeat protein [Polyangiaceae bacterium]